MRRPVLRFLIPGIWLLLGWPVSAATLGGGDGTGPIERSATQSPGPVQVPVPVPVPVPDASTWRELAPGVVLEEVHRWSPAGPQAFWVTRIAPGSARLRVVRADPGPDGRPGLQPVSELARKVGAIVAVNGGFFSPQDRIPLGLVQVAGELVAGPLFRRSALTVAPEIRIDRPQVLPWVALPDGESAEVDFMNLKPQADTLVLFTVAWGPRTGTAAGPDTFEAAVTGDGLVIGTGAADLGIPPGGFVLSATGTKARWLRDRLQRGGVVRLNGGLDEYWGPVSEAIGGGPTLVRNGTASVATDERFRPDITKGRAARTAVGICRDRTTLIVAIAGVVPTFSIGMTLEELAGLLVELGADSALNLDGGSSTTMWADGMVLDRPSGARERPVANALAVVN